MVWGAEIGCGERIYPPATYTVEAMHMAGSNLSDLVVPPEKKALAQVVIGRLLYNKRRRLSLNHYNRRPPTYLKDSDSLRHLQRLTAEEIAELEKEAAKWIQLVDHPVRDLFDCQQMPSAASIAIVANPPQVTTRKFGMDLGCFVPTSAWIDHGFVKVRYERGGVKTERAHRNVLVRYTESLWYNYLKMNLRNGERLIDALKRVFNEKLAKYGYFEAREIAERAPRRSREYRDAVSRMRRAFAFAEKEVFRVMVGNAWLVWHWAALEARIIEPIDVVLPYTIAHAPNPVERAKTFIDPRHTFVKAPRHPLLAKAVLEAS